MPAKLNSCPVPGVSPKDSRLTELRKEKAYEKYNEAYLAHALNYMKRMRPGQYADDWVPSTPSERAVFTRFIRYEIGGQERARSSSEMSDESIRNVYTALYDLYRPEMLDDRISMMANDFIDELDKVAGVNADEETRREKLLAIGNDKKNGFKVLMERVFSKYEKNLDAHHKYELWLAGHPNATELQKRRAQKFYERAAKEYQKILDNKGILSAFVATKVGNDEGFKVKTEGFEVTFQEIQDEDLVNEEQLGAENNDADVYESYKGDRYVDFRILKMMDTLGPRARKLLSRIERTDVDGEPSRDDLYKKRYLNPRSAAVVLQRALVHSSPETMLEDISAMGDVYPWLKSFVDDVLVKDKEAQTTIYCAFKKAETLNIYDEKKGNTYKSTFANSRSKGRSLMEEAGTNLRSGTPMSKYSIVTGSGWLDGKKISEGYKAAKALQEKVKAISNVRMVEGDKIMARPTNEYAGMEPAEAIKKYLNDNPELSEEIAQLLRGLGFPVTAKDVEVVAEQKITKKGYKFIVFGGSGAATGRNKLSILATGLLKAYDRARQAIANSKDVAPTGQSFYNTSDKELTKITDILALSKFYDTEPRVLAGNKSINTFNNVNLLSQISEQLFNEDELSVDEYRDRLISEFGRYEGMAITEVDPATGQESIRLTGWLKYLYDNAELLASSEGDRFRVYSNPGFNHREYAKLSDKQKLTSSIIQYLTAGQSMGSPAMRGYEMPIKSDYSTAYDFILAPKFGEDEIIDALVDELLCEIERINDIEKRVSVDPDGRNRAKLDAYESEGLKIHLFPELNDVINNEEFRLRLINAGAQERRDILRQFVVDGLEKVYQGDVKVVDDTKILSNKLLAPHKLYSPIKTNKEGEKTGGKVSDLSEAGQKIIREWSLNEFYARYQMVKLFDGGLHNFDGNTDFKKRNMLLHTTRTSLYTKAWWGGQQVGKESQRVAYIKDEVSRSAFYDSISEVLDNLKKEKLITSRQYDTMMSAYANINSTDGQGFRTLESYRDVMIMSDQWSDKLENAYKRIISGKPLKSDINQFLKIIKPMTTGFEVLDTTATGGKKPVKLTVLHKYSEAPLLPIALAKYCLTAQSVPLRAFARTAEKVGVDLFLFESCVKVGSHSTAEPFIRDKDNQRVYKNEDELTAYLTQALSAHKWNIHEIPYKYYGISASTPVHTVDGKITRASQMEKTALSNLRKGDKITIKGEEHDAFEMRDLYYKIKTAGIVEAYNDLRKLFNDTDELSEIFREELVDKTYVSRELRFALAHLKSGKFALPLFSPNVGHQVEQILLSIINKRMTKKKGRGANMLVSSAVGLEVSDINFEGNFPDLAKLGMEFGGEGSQKHIKWFDAGLGLPESLREFADENGNITFERLWGRDGTGKTEGLVFEGIIPASALMGVMSRTPSDAEHSTVRYRVKWFTSALEAGSGKVAKEAIVMTGQDFDGDKLRVDFKEFRKVWDEEAMKADYEKFVSGVDENDDLSVVQTILGQKNGEIPSYEEWSSSIKRKSNPDWRKYRKVVMDEYDLSKSPFEQSDAARHNMQIDILMGMLTSVSGSRRVLIPGGCEESKIYAKSLHLTRLAADEENRKKIYDALVSDRDSGGLGMNPETAHKLMRSTYTRYNGFIGLKSKQLDKIIKRVSTGESIFTMADSLKSFSDIMGGAEMIEVYALYNSAQQMMQRLDIHYVPAKKKNGEDLKIKIFDHEIDKLFDVTGSYGQLNSLGLASLLNAAVDNGKDPILGYLHQTPEMAEMTAFLSAAGFGEEEIHLIMNQPAVIELVNRMRDTGSGIAENAQQMIGEMQNRFGEDRLKLYKAIDIISRMSRDDYVSYLDAKYSDIANVNNTEVGELNEQSAILYLLMHLNRAATNLSDFIKATRPESNSGAVGGSIANVINKKSRLDEMRELVGDESLDAVQKAEIDREVRLSGIREVLSSRSIDYGMANDVIMEEIGDSLPEIVSLNSLMIDGTPQMLAPYFPQAKESWYRFISRIASMYRYISPKDSTFNTAATYAILYKLLEDKSFAPGDISENRHEAITETPFALQDIQVRIKRVEKQKADGQQVEDKEAERLIGNQFLSHLFVTSPEPGNSNSVPRISFNLNGPAIEGQADTIRAYWGDMLKSPYAGTRALAIDLFTYNLYNAGFGYGMYEFAHFVPMSVVMSVPGYVDALNKLVDKAEWNDDEEIDNAINQYVQNYWGDDKFLFYQKLSDLKFLDRDNTGKYPVWTVMSTPVLQAAADRHNGFVIISDSDGNQSLFKVINNDTSKTCVLHGVTKLGVRLTHGQATIQVDPQCTYDTIEPTITGNESSWGQIDMNRSDYFAEANYNAEDPLSGELRTGGYANERSARNATLFVPGGIRGVYKGSQKALSQTQDIQKSAEIADSKNEENLKNIKNNEQVTEANPEIPEENVVAPVVVGPGALFMPKGLFQIARRDDNGNAVTDKVPSSPAGILEARRQRAYVQLGKRLREILKEHGVSVGVLDEFETRLNLNGITDFDTRRVTAEGLVEMIRIAEGVAGDMALPEEFAHLAIAMIGVNNSMVQRLMEVLSNNEEALREAFGDQYDEYMEAYKGDEDKMLIEAAGKIVAKQLLYEQEIKTSPIRSLIRRIVDAIKAFFRQFSKDRIKNAIFDSEQISRELARQFLGGQILDDKTIADIDMSGELLQKAEKVKKDLTEKDDILNKLLKIELKKRDAYIARLGYSKEGVKQSKAVQSVDKNISRLEAGIRNMKTEDAVITYLNDSTDFLDSTYKSLRSVVESGRPANDVCRKLNIVRDTLYAVALSLNDVRQAVQKQEIYDTINLRDSLKKVEDMLSSFFKYYERIAKHYFEGMLADVYGKDGLTVTVGRDKGRVITIDELASRADRDITMASRWFNAIADCGDPVLSAIDEYVRSAKIRSRNRIAEFRPKLEAAYAELARETGSSSTDFMFEKERGKDGKLHKTGKYISAKDSEKLSNAQRKYYNIFMDLKAEVDRCMPESLLQDRKIVMLRKKMWDRVKEQEGIKNKTIETWEGIKTSILETGDNIDFDNYEVRVDFEGNQIDMLPVHYLAKGKNESYDDMSDDATTALMAYAGMAFEYHEMNGIIAILENAKYMASQRDVAQKVGRKNKRETIDTKDYLYHKNFTVKQARTQMQNALEDFFQMHVYGHIQKNEGTIGNTKISKRKLTNAINMMVSYSQMALNIPQRIANVGVGITQIGIESAGKDILNAKNISWASGIWTKYGADRMAETGKADYDNRLSLWLDYFDVHQDNGRKFSSNKHGDSRVGRFFNTHLLFAGLTIGEDYLSSVTALSVARDYKMKDKSGKEINLWDAFEVAYINHANKEGAYLKLKDGVTKSDGSKFTMDDVQKITKQIASLNFEMQGIYNLDDRSAVQQYAFGSLIIMYRKWIAPAMKRRYARTHYNALTGRWEEGFHTTWWHLISDTYKDAKDQVSEEEGLTTLQRIVETLKAYQGALKINKGKLTGYELSNLRKHHTEMAIWLGLIALTFLFTKLPPPDPDKDDVPITKFLSWTELQIMALVFRLNTEVGSMAPTPTLLDEGLKILKSPFAAIGPLRDATNLVQVMLPWNWTTTIKSGKDKGHTKAYHYFWNLPVLSMRRKLQNFKNPTALINYYKNDNF